MAEGHKRCQEATATLGAAASNAEVEAKIAEAFAKGQESARAEGSKRKHTAMELVYGPQDCDFKVSSQSVELSSSRGIRKA